MNKINDLIIFIHPKSNNVLITLIKNYFRRKYILYESLGWSIISLKNYENENLADID